MKMLILHTAGTTGFLGVDWSSIALVFIVALVVVVAVVSLYSTGLLLLSSGDSAATRPRIVTAAAWLCIGIGGVAALYGIYLVIPVFHR
jgi:hypothetical protein